MDKWFKDILPDKDLYHNRGRDQMRKNGGPEFECLWLFPLQNGKIVPSLPRTMKKTRNLSIIFLIIYMYLNLVNNQRLMSQHIDNSQAVTTINFWTDYEKKYMLFSINFAWNGTPFPHHMYKWIIFMINKKHLNQDK